MIYLLKLRTHKKKLAGLVGGHKPKAISNTLPTKCAT
jgi:hypothetical protein